MMTCGRARRLLWPDGGPRAATAEIVAAREHTGRCPQCREFLEDMRRLAELVRQAVPRPDAPVDVRDRLFKAIARARIDGPAGTVARRRRLWAAVAAAGLLAGGTWVALGGVGGREVAASDPLGTIVADHLRRQGHTSLASSDSLEVARWLGDRVPFQVAIPLFPDARIAGARLMLANGQSAAVVDYVIAGHPLSYYVLPRSGTGRAAAGAGIRLTSRTGYRIAAWDDGDLTHALVAGLPGPKLVELAHYCIEQTAGRQLISRADPAGGARLHLGLSDPEPHLPLRSRADAAPPASRPGGARIG